MGEERVGVVSHYYGKLGVAAVVMEGELSTGDVIRIKGNKTDFTQKVDAIQLEHKDVDTAKKGDDVGIMVKEYAREHDVVYKVVAG